MSRRFDQLSSQDLKQGGIYVSISLRIYDNKGMSGKTHGSDLKVKSCSRIYIPTLCQKNCFVIISKNMPFGKFNSSNNRPYCKHLRHKYS